MLEYLIIPYLLILKPNDFKFKFAVPVLLEGAVFTIEHSNVIDLRLFLAFGTQLFMVINMYQM